MSKEYDHKKYGSVMKGRSAEQLASYNRDISPKHKALEAKKGKKSAIPKSFKDGLDYNPRHQ